MYHRVIELPADPNLLCVTPEHFEQHLKVLTRDFRVLSLGELAESLRSGELTNRSIVITFDDGYADNLENAAPLLQRYGAHATVFVTTGAIGQEREFWWDELERLILRPSRLPDPLELRIGPTTHRWETGDFDGHAGEETAGQQGWNVEQPNDPGPRQRLYRSLYALFRPLPTRERDRALQNLREAAGLGSTGRPTHRTLSTEELARLAALDLIEIGAHTVTHPLLATLPVETQRSEIIESKSRLESLLGRPITSFSYPHGSLSADTVAIVRQAQLSCACTSEYHPVWPRDDPFLLPRVVLPDWDGDRFARQIREWMRG